MDLYSYQINNRNTFQANCYLVMMKDSKSINCFRFLAFICLLLIPIFGYSIERWVVYYSDVALISTFEPYDLTVFDSHRHPLLDPLNNRGKTTLGYISLGEVRPEYPYFKEMEEEGILLEENDIWKGNRMVDLRSPLWTQRVIEELVPTIINKKFDGIFIDTIDNAAFLENQNPIKYKGMKQAAANLIKSIRYHFPSIKIMMNRGYELLEDLADDIDMVLGESVYTTYNFDSKEYKRLPKKIYYQQRDFLSNMQKAHPKLQVFTLDYWDPKDASGIKEIYKAERANGFIPYVSTISLQEVIPEPN